MDKYPQFEIVGYADLPIDRSLTEAVQGRINVRAPNTDLAMYSRTANIPLRLSDARRVVSRTNVADDNWLSDTPIQIIHNILSDLEMQRAAELGTEEEPYIQTHFHDVFVCTRLVTAMREDNFRLQEVALTIANETHNLPLVELQAPTHSNTTDAPASALCASQRTREGEVGSCHDHFPGKSSRLQTFRHQA